MDICIQSIFLLKTEKTPESLKTFSVKQKVWAPSWRQREGGGSDARLHHFPSGWGSRGGKLWWSVIQDLQPRADGS